MHRSQSHGSEDFIVHLIPPLHFVILGQCWAMLWLQPANLVKWTLAPGIEWSLICIFQQVPQYCELPGWTLASLPWRSSSTTPLTTWSPSVQGHSSLGHSPPPQSLGVLSLSRLVSLPARLETPRGSLAHTRHTEALTASYYSVTVCLLH